MSEIRNLERLPNLLRRQVVSALEREHLAAALERSGHTVCDQQPGFPEFTAIVPEEHDDDCLFRPHTLAMADELLAALRVPPRHDLNPLIAVALAVVLCLAILGLVTFVSAAMSLR